MLTKRGLFGLAVGGLLILVVGVWVTISRLGAPDADARRAEHVLDTVTLSGFSKVKRFDEKMQSTDVYLGKPTARPKWSGTQQHLRARKATGGQRGAGSPGTRIRPRDDIRVRRLRRRTRGAEARS